MKTLFFFIAILFVGLTSCQKDEYPNIKIEQAPIIPLYVDSVGVETLSPDSL